MERSLHEMVVALRRRTIVLSGAATAGVLALSSLRHLLGRNDAIDGSLLGPLLRDPRGLLDLPRGFSYQVIQQSLAPMDDGFLVPRRPDGMACFTTASGSWCLMRNHELGQVAGEQDYLRGHSVGQAFRPQAFGAVSRVELQPGTARVLRSNLVLTGTDRNCAGGISPWGWLSCEESMDSDHGFVFLCSVSATSVQEPTKLEAYGRCRREAAAVDSLTSVAYLTEDEPDSCFYRFLPEDPRHPFVGKLQALAVAGRPKLDLGAGLRVGDALPVQWVDLIRDPLAQHSPLRVQAQSLGAAVIRRGEGLWLHERAAYFTSTNGGPVGAGQVFSLSLDGPQELRLVAQSESRATLDMPDNLTVSARGGIYLAEDGYGGQFLRGLGPDGSVFDLARNARSTSEFAGLCFSPDGQVLFMNLQEDGLTVAVRGPFPV